MRQLLLVATAAIGLGTGAWAQDGAVGSVGNITDNNVNANSTSSNSAQNDAAAK